MLSWEHTSGIWTWLYKYIFIPATDVTLYVLETAVSQFVMCPADV